MVWEYKTAVNEIRITLDLQGHTGFNVQETDQFLNIMGKDQWELIDTNPIVSNGHTTQIAYFFKRPAMRKPESIPEIGYDIDHNGITGSQR